MLKLPDTTLCLLLLLVAVKTHVTARDELDDIYYPDTRQALYNAATMAKLRARFDEFNPSFNPDSAGAGYAAAPDRFEPLPALRSQAP